VSGPDADWQRMLLPGVAPDWRSAKQSLVLRLVSQTADAAGAERYRRTEDFVRPGLEEGRGALRCGSGTGPPREESLPG
jgi:hypothetical protein